MNEFKDRNEHTLNPIGADSRMIRLVGLSQECLATIIAHLDVSLYEMGLERNVIILTSGHLPNE